MRRPSAGGPAHPRGVRRLLLTAGVAAALAVVAGGAVGTLALIAGLTALAAAAALAMRAQWVAAAPPPREPAPAPGSPADGTEELHRLRAEHLAQVDAALDEGRHDIARALVDAHQEQVRRLAEGRAAQPR